MHNFNVRLSGKDDALIEAQVFQSHLGVALSKTLEDIYNLNQENRLRAEMLIVRMPVELQWNPEDLKNRQSESVHDNLGNTIEESNYIFARAKDRSVHIMGSHNGVLFITPNLSPHWSNDPFSIYGLEEKRVLDEIRAAEMEYIVDHSRAILSLPQGSLYLTPSRRIAQSFIRVGNIQYNRDAIDAIFYWLLPYLSNVVAILTDTWSISSIAFNISRLLAIYTGEQAPRVELLASYNDGSDIARQNSRTIIERLECDFTASNRNNSLQERVMLCLISATQTGSLAEYLEKIFLTSAIDLKPRFVTLFRLGSSSLPTLHDLSKDDRFTLLSDSDGNIDANQGAPIKIDPQIYFPLTFQDTIFQLDKKSADYCKSFYERYIGKGLIQVHCDHAKDEGRTEHHAIHLATEVLLNVPDFVTSFEAKLQALPTRPKFIVSPPHDAGQSLAQHAKKYFERHRHFCPVFSHPNLFIQKPPSREEEQQIQNNLKEASVNDSILIIDDVCITGTRLSQYQRYVRTEHYKGRIDYLVAIARPRDMEDWEYYKRYLGYRGNNLPRHTVNAVDQVLLPDWRENECPWCKEKRFYQKWLDQTKNLPSILMNRLEKLSHSMKNGLVDDIFLRFPNRDLFTLGPDSIFAPERANQAEVFAAISSGLQYLRTIKSEDRPLLGPRRFPISTVLRFDDYVRAKWTDSILRASILRAANLDELTYADGEFERLRMIAVRKLITEPTEKENEIALELLLAATEEKCSLSPINDLKDQLRTFDEPDVINYFLARIAELEPRR